MSLSMYQASVPVFQQLLSALSGVLDKADAHAAARKIEPSVLLADRLYPDMFPLTRQVQIATDFARGCTARLAGKEVPAYDNTEKTFAELKARIQRSLDFIASVKPAEIDAAAGREIVHPVAGNPVKFTGEGYLTRFALPHFYFHCATAYDILRHNGVEVGKRDYIGKHPGVAG